MSYRTAIFEQNYDWLLAEIFSYFIVLYLFAIYHKFVISYIYKFVKSRIDKNNSVCDEKNILLHILI